MVPYHSKDCSQYPRAIEFLACTAEIQQFIQNQHTASMSIPTLHRPIIEGLETDEEIWKAAMAEYNELKETDDSGLNFDKQDVPVGCLRAPCRIATR